MSSSNSAWTTTAAAISAVALWGLAFPLIQKGLNDFSPIVLGFVRFGLASAVLAAAVAFRYTAREVMDTVRREWRPLLLFGILYVTVPNITQNMGLRYGTSSIASVIQSSGPVMTLIFAVILLSERMTRLKGVGTAVALGGTFLLVLSGGVSLGNVDFVGNILILASAVSYGLAWVSAKRMLERNPPILIIGLSLVLGTVVLGLAVPFDGSPTARWTASSLLDVSVLGILCAGASSVLYLTSLEHEEVSRMAFFIYLMPVFASVCAWAILGQGVAAWTVVCGVIIVAGIIFANMGEPGIGN